MAIAEDGRACGRCLVGGHGSASGGAALTLRHREHERGELGLEKLSKRSEAEVNMVMGDGSGSEVLRVPLGWAAEKEEGVLVMIPSGVHAGPSRRASGAGSTGSTVAVMVLEVEGSRRRVVQCVLPSREPQVVVFDAPDRDGGVVTAAACCALAHSNENRDGNDGSTMLILVALGYDDGSVTAGLASCRDMQTRATVRWSRIVDGSDRARLGVAVDALMDTDGDDSNMQPPPAGDSQSIFQSVFGGIFGASAAAAAPLPTGSSKDNAGDGKAGGNGAGHVSEMDCSSPSVARLCLAVGGTDLLVLQDGNLSMIHLRVDAMDHRDGADRLPIVSVPRLHINVKAVASSAMQALAERSGSASPIDVRQLEVLDVLSVYTDDGGHDIFVAVFAYTVYDTNGNVGFRFDGGGSHAIAGDVGGGEEEARLPCLVHYAVAILRRAPGTGAFGIHEGEMRIVGRPVIPASAPAPAAATRPRLPRTSQPSALMDARIRIGGDINRRTRAVGTESSIAHLDVLQFLMQKCEYVLMYADGVASVLGDAGLLSIQDSSGTRAFHSTGRAAPVQHGASATAAVFTGAGGPMGATFDAIWSGSERQGYWSFLAQNAYIGNHTEARHHASGGNVAAMAGDAGQASLRQCLLSSYGADSFAPFQFEMERVVRYIVGQVDAGAPAVSDGGFGSYLAGRARDGPADGSDSGSSVSASAYWLLNAVGVMDIRYPQNPLLRYSLELLNSFPKTKGGGREAVNADGASSFDLGGMAKQLEDKLAAYNHLLQLFASVMVPIVRVGAAKKSDESAIEEFSSLLSLFPHDIRKLFLELGEKANAARAIHGLYSSLVEGQGSPPPQGPVPLRPLGGGAAAHFERRMAVQRIIDFTGRSLLSASSGCRSGAESDDDEAMVSIESDSREDYYFFFSRTATCVDQFFKCTPDILNEVRGVTGTASVAAADQRRPSSSIVSFRSVAEFALVCYKGTGDVCKRHATTGFGGGGADGDTMATEGVRRAEEQAADSVRQPWTSYSYVRCALHKILINYIQCLDSTYGDGDQQRGNGGASFLTRMVDDFNTCTDVFECLLHAITSSYQTGSCGTLAPGTSGQHAGGGGHDDGLAARPRNARAELTDTRELLFNYLMIAIGAISRHREGDGESSSGLDSIVLGISRVAEQYYCFKPLLRSLQFLGMEKKIYHLMRIVGSSAGADRSVDADASFAGDTSHGFADFVVSHMLSSTLKVPVALQTVVTGPDASSAADAGISARIPTNLLSEGHVNVMELPNEFNDTVERHILRARESASSVASRQLYTDMLWMHQTRCEKYADAARTLAELSENHEDATVDFSRYQCLAKIAGAL